MTYIPRKGRRPLPNAPVLTIAEKALQRQQIAKAMARGEGDPYGRGGMPPRPDDRPVPRGVSAGHSAPRPIAKRPPPAVIPVAHNAPINGGPSLVRPVDPLQAQAQAQVDPLVAALSSRIEARAKAGAGAITGYTNQLAQSLGGQEQHAAGIWGAAQQAQAASDAAQAQRLTGQGAELAAGLSQKLASVNAPAAVGQTTANVQQTGAGAGNALYGTGSAAQGQLIAEGAAARDYASKLPGIARLGGLQSMRDLELKSQSDLADQTARVQEQIPGIVDTLRQRQEQTRQFNVSQAEGKRQFARQQATQMFLAKLATEKDDKKAIADWKKFNAQQDRLDARAAASAAHQDARTQAQIDAANARAQTAADTAATKASTAAAAAQQPKAAADADTFYYGVPPKTKYVTVTKADGTKQGKWIDVPGTGTPGVDYPTAIRRLQAKYPALSVDQIKALLNDYYAPGERGRPGGPKKPPPVTPGEAADAVAPPPWTGPLP